MIWINQIRVGSQTLGHPKHYEVKGINYVVTICQRFRELLCIFDLSGHRVSLLDEDFDWYWKCSSATDLVFKHMGSHIIGISI